MTGLSIESMRKLCFEKHVLWSAHAFERMQQRGITRRDVLNIIDTGKIIEDYPDDYPYPSCLISGCGKDGRVAHVVCGSNGETVKIITAYYPSEDVFDISGEKRKEKAQ